MYECVGNIYIFSKNVDTIISRGGTRSYHVVSFFDVQSYQGGNFYSVAQSMAWSMTFLS